MTLKEAEKRIAALEAQVDVLVKLLAQRQQVVHEHGGTMQPWWQYPYTVTAGTTSAASGGTITFINRNDDGPEPSAVSA